MLRALIFDVDGTLAETEESHRAAFNAAFAAHGRDWRWEPDLYRELLRVTGGKERLRHFSDRSGAALADSEIALLHGAKNAEYARLVASGACPLRPGVAGLIAAARARGLKLAIATTTSRENVEALLAATMGGAAAFDAIVAGDEVARKKPAPDVYLKARELLDVPADECLAFEDSRNGLLAALAAGIATVVTPSLYTQGEEFSGAREVRADLEGFALA